MQTNRDWMYQRHDEQGYLSMIFIEKVKDFIDFAAEQETYQTIKNIKCSCAKCWNVPYVDIDIVKLHPYKRGFWLNYYEWACHGETFEEVSHLRSSSNMGEGANSLRNMVLDAYALIASCMEGERMNYGEEEPFVEVKKFIELVQALEKPLYEKFDMSLLKAIAQLTNLKYEFNLPHRIIDEIASLMKAMCSNDNEMTAIRPLFDPILAPI